MICKIILVKAISSTIIGSHLPVLYIDSLT